jgi:hypothetical protein
LQMPANTVVFAVAPLSLLPRLFLQAAASAIQLPQPCKTLRQFDCDCSCKQLHSGCLHAGTTWIVAAAHKWTTVSHGCASSSVHACTGCSTMTIDCAVTVAAPHAGRQARACRPLALSSSYAGASRCVSAALNQTPCRLLKQTKL